MATESSTGAAVVSGEVVAWLVNDSAFTSEAEAIEVQQWWPSGSIAIPLVKASDLDAMQAERDALRELLSQVAGCFTREDDLPDNLLPRIDRALTDQGRAGEGR